MAPRLFLLYSTLDQPTRERVSAAVRDALVDAGAPEPRIHHFMNGVTAVAAEVDPALEAEIVARHPEIRAVEPNLPVVETQAAPRPPRRQ